MRSKADIREDGQVQVMPSFTRIPAFERIVTDASFKGWTVA